MMDQHIRKEDYPFKFQMLSSSIAVTQEELGADILFVSSLQQLCSRLLIIYQCSAMTFGLRFLCSIGFFTIFPRMLVTKICLQFLIDVGRCDWNGDATAQAVHFQFRPPIGSFWCPILFSRTDPSGSTSSISGRVVTQKAVSNSLYPNQHR